MNNLQKRLLTFLIGCIGTRTLFVYLAKNANRTYLQYMGYNDRIIIVASPNVQENFYLQLFDETKLELNNGYWTINNCAGQNILNEINVLQKNLSREKVIKIVKNIISNYYLLMLIRIL